MLSVCLAFVTTFFLWGWGLGRVRYCQIFPPPLVTMFTGFVLFTLLGFDVKRR